MPCQPAQAWCTWPGFWVPQEIQPSNADSIHLESDVDTPRPLYTICTILSTACFPHCFCPSGWGNRTSRVAATLHVGCFMSNRVASRFGSGMGVIVIGCVFGL